MMSDETLSKSTHVWIHSAHVLAAFCVSIWWENMIIAEEDYGFRTTRSMDVRNDEMIMMFICIYGVTSVYFTVIMSTCFPIITSYTDLALVYSVLMIVYVLSNITYLRGYVVFGNHLDAPYYVMDLDTHASMLGSTPVDFSPLRDVGFHTYTRRNWLSYDDVRGYVNFFQRQLMYADRPISDRLCADMTAFTNLTSIVGIIFSC